ncbi:MAG: peroxiredoxin [Polyangiales bacterium]
MRSSSRLAASFVVVVTVGSLVACKETPRENPPAQPAVSSASAAAASLPTLKPGDDAPALSAKASNGAQVDLAALKGKNVVVYFYPKDDTPGCTKEANGFKDSFTQLTEKDIVVVGVSEQDDTSHQAFTQKYELPFALVADTDGKIAKAFGVPVDNGHAARMSFLIGKDGKIKKVYPKVDPSAHSAEILTDATS